MYKIVLQYKTNEQLFLLTKGGGKPFAIGMFIRHGGKGVKCHGKYVASDCITAAISIGYEGFATLPYPLVDQDPPIYII
jgi:hypothetical protein